MPRTTTRPPPTIARPTGLPEAIIRLVLEQKEREGPS